MNFAVKTAFGERFAGKRLLSATIFFYNNDMKTDIVAEIRKFNRAYTAVIGILNGTYLDSGITVGRLNEKSDDMISALISDVSERRRDELVAAMRSISEILGLED